MSEHVILVDANDTPIGTAEKLEAHRSGQLHRAFSAFVFNDRGELLLQRRADGKYHSGGLWSNTCCSHPRPGEAIEAAAERRLQEEMGFRCPLEAVTAIVYRAEVGGGLVEYEYDHLLIGRWNGRPSPNAEEVGDWRWADVDELRDEVVRAPRSFTYWFRVALLELDERGLLPDRADRVA